MLKIQFEGHKELRKLLKNTPPMIFAKAVVPSARRAMAPVSKLAKKNITAAKAKETGLLRKSIGTKSKAYKRHGNVWVGVGARTGFRQSVTLKDGRTVLRNPVKYVHLVEQGFRHRNGTQIPGRVFLRSAMLAERNKIEQRLAAELGSKIPALTAKLHKKK